MKRRTFMMAYAFTDHAGSTGVGRTFVTFTGLLSREAVEEIEQTTRRQNRFAQLTATNFVELEKVSEQ